MTSPPRASRPTVDAERTTSFDRVLMEPAKPSGTDRDGGARDNLTDEPSVTSSLEHLLASSQGVISKRIDLALLEGREMLSRTGQGAALAGFGAVLIAAAWLSLAASAVLLAFPDASWVVRLAAFGLLNAACALALVALAMRRVRRETPAPPDVSESRPNSAA